MNKRLSRLRLQDHLPDPRRPALPDLRERNQFFRAELSASHSTLTVGNTQTQTTTEQQRIRSVQVGAVSGGTVTVQVQVDGRDMFLDGHRPVSGSGPSDSSDVYVFPAGSVVSTIIEASSGVPTGTAQVAIETEPYVLLPWSDTVQLHGKLRISRRRVADDLNAGLVFRGAEATQARQSAIGRSVVAEPKAPSGPAGTGGDLQLPDLTNPPKPPKGGIGFRGR